MEGQSIECSLKGTRQVTFTYLSRRSASDKEIEPAIQTPLGEPQPLDSKKRGQQEKDQPLFTSWKLLLRQ